MKIYQNAYADNIIDDYFIKKIKKKNEIRNNVIM